MLIARTLQELSAARTRLGADISLVPTMGALHDGHLSLVATALASGGKVAASVFVNHLQFGPNEDFSRYPRDEAGDIAKLELAGCDLVWLPDAAMMYPPDAASTVHVAGPANLWEGAIRPGHFTGVATVVAKLFGQVRPARAYFGEKDWQQIQVITRMVTDLLIPVQIIPVTTVREPDGLALSSRNRFLGTVEREAAPALYAVLTHAAERLAGGGDVAEVLAKGDAALKAAGLAPDYFNLVHAQSLEPIASLFRPARLIAAAKLGSIRLLDNVTV